METFKVRISKLEQQSAKYESVLTEISGLKLHIAKIKEKIELIEQALEKEAGIKVDTPKQ